MRKQIRLKNETLIIECCEECPCHIYRYGTCKILKKDMRTNYKKINNDCPLEDAE